MVRSSWRIDALAQVDFPGLTREEKETLESRVSALRSVCGCRAGSAASVTALAVYLVFISISHLDDGLSGVVLGLVGVVSAAFAGIVAKAAAIAVARYRLHRLVTDAVEGRLA